MNQKLIREELEWLGMHSKTWSHNQCMTFSGLGPNIIVKFVVGTWDITFTATIEETTEAGESVKATLTTLRDGLQAQLDTLDGMLARYDEVKE